MGKLVIIGRVAVGLAGAHVVSCSTPAGLDDAIEESAEASGSLTAEVSPSQPATLLAPHQYQLRGDRPPSALALQMAYPTPPEPIATIPEPLVEAPVVEAQSEPLSRRERRKAKRKLSKEDTSSYRAKEASSGKIQRVRTTAYCRDEGDHFIFGSMSAMGKPLRLGAVRSAAADWSRYPAGTQFKIAGDPAIYEIDDYGSALVGGDTIDLYQPHEIAMEEWGVRHVDIEILRWGSRAESLRILRSRSGRPHIDAMIRSLETSDNQGEATHGR